MFESSLILARNTYVVLRSPPPLPIPREPLRDKDNWEVYVAIGSLATRPMLAGYPAIELSDSALPCSCDTERSYASINAKHALRGDCAGYTVSMPLQHECEAGTGLRRWVGPVGDSLASHSAIVVEHERGHGGHECEFPPESLWSPGSGLLWTCAPSELHLLLEVRVGRCGIDKLCTIGIAQLTPKS